MPLRARSYQLEAANIAVLKNTIVNIRTGGGKTLIAVLVIDHFLINERRGKLVLFIVPSRALVAQQSEYLRKNVTWKGHDHGQLNVVEMCGNELDSWDRLKWRKCISENHILVGTAEVFRLAFVDQGFITPSDFSLIVFDECHNAVGNHPMAAILRDSILRAESHNRPRVLGLTASFNNGSEKNILRKRSDLESLFNANLIAPIVDDTSVKDKFFFPIKYPEEDLNLFELSIKPIIESILRPIEFEIGKDFNSWVKRGFDLFVELGLEGLRFWLREGLVIQLSAHRDEMKKRPTDVFCARIANRLDASLPSIHKILQDATVSIPTSSNPPPYSQKLISLLELLYSLIGQSNGKRGIVFVEQVSMTYPCAFLVNKYFTEKRKNARCLQGKKYSPFSYFKLNSRFKTSCTYVGGDYKMGEVDIEFMLPVSGANSMPDRIRTRNLDMFRNGAIPLIVSTNALEEGIDVPECEFVVRFDSFSTTKSHIQGSGRARCDAAKIFYFENDPLLECSKADTMESIGQNRNLNLSAKELEKSLQEIRSQSTNGANSTVNYPFKPPASTLAQKEGTSSDRKAVSDPLTPIPSVVYPESVAKIDYDDESGEVNFFNCLSIFYKYVQRTTKQSFNPDCLFEWTKEIVRDFPYEDQMILTAVHFPTKTGYQVLSHEEMDKFWEGYKVEDVVIPKERYAKLTAADKEKRRAVYVLVVKLHQLNLLTASNEPTADALNEIKHSCATLPMVNKLTIKNKFPSELLTPQKASDISQASKLLRTGLAEVPSSSDFTDFKSELQRLVQKKHPNVAPNTILRYDTKTLGEGSFVSAVHADGGIFAIKTATGKTCRKKKDAEQSAAQHLLQLLG